MFGLNRKQRPEPVLVTPSSTPPATADSPGQASDNGHLEQLRRWMSLAELQRRVIQALASEITCTSSYVETEGDNLSGRFQRLAISAQQQTQRVDSLTNLAMAVEMDGEPFPIEQIASMLEATLADVVVKILMLSKDSMAMVYAFNSLSEIVERVGLCNGQIDTINRTLNMLVLNARIEAERSGQADAAFRVVANEVRELSKSAQTLATTMDQELRTITEGLANSHARLRRIAMLDMSDNILVKERLEVLLKAMVTRNSKLETIVTDAVKEAETITTDVEGMVTGIQFQDRTKQRLEHVVATLHVVRQAIEDIKLSAVAALPELGHAADLDAEWVNALLARYTMSDLRDRFVAQILQGSSEPGMNDSAQDVEPSSSGSMELFRNSKCDLTSTAPAFRSAGS